MSPQGQHVTVCGWVRTKRESKNLLFVQVNDGSCFASMQLTFDKSSIASHEGTSSLKSIEDTLKRLSTGVSVRAWGTLSPSPAAGQAVEVITEGIEVLGECDSESYPLQKKKMTMEYLRGNAHLRSRTNTFGAVFRVRSQLAFAVHSFFQERGFYYINAPEITCSDCEGAGQMFQVISFQIEQLLERAVKAGAGGMKAEEAHKIVDWSKDFFGKKAFLTVSGQLEAEAMACALGLVYTFGPTFRAENSNTPRHLSEFWMIEPEMAFYDLEDDMDLQEEFIKYLLNWVFCKCPDELSFFDKRVQPGLLSSLQKTASSTFKRISYTEAVALLEKADARFEFKPEWGSDIATEHEKYLTEKVFGSPVMVFDYPKSIKSFYMKANDDGKTVRAVDVLVPGIGEIIGGSQREEDLGKLVAAIEERGMDSSAYDWYIDLRRFGTVPHSGFGLGFERMVRYVTGMENIRDVIPFPRAPKLASF